MNYIETKFQNGNNVFIVSTALADEIESVQISDKNVPFMKYVIDEDNTEVRLDFNESFPIGIFFNLNFLDKENQIMKFQVDTERVVPFFGEIQGILKTENDCIQIKFLRFNELFKQMRNAPTISIQGIYTLDKRGVNRKATNFSSELLVIARQKDVLVQHIVPLTYEDSRINISPSYLTGFFDLELILLENEHVFRISQNPNINEGYELIRKQNQDYLGSWNKVIEYEGIEDDKLSFSIKNDSPINEVFLITDNLLSKGQWIEETQSFMVNNLVAENMQTACLLLETNSGFYTKNLQGINIDGKVVASIYVDLTKYDFNKRQIKKAVPLSIKDINITDTFLQFSLNDTVENPIYSDTPFLLIKQRKKNKFYYIHGKRNSNHFEFNFYFLLDQLENKNGLRWNLFLMDNPKSNVSYQIGMFEESILEKPARFLQPFKQAFENNSTYKQYTRPYITVNNELALVKNTASNLIKEEYKLKAKVVGFKMKKNIVDLQIDIISPYIDDIQLSALQLIQRNKDMLDVRSYSIRKVTNFNGKATIESTIDLKNSNLSPLYWDLYISITKDNKEYYVKISSVTQKIAWDVNQTISKYQYNVNDKDIIYPYITLSNYLSFTYREKEFYENRYYLLKENLAYLYVQLFYKHFAKREIWLAFEKLAVSAHDSGYYFFDYVYKNNKHDEFYYIIQRDSPELENLEDKRDRVIYFMTFKYFVYMFAAKLLISSDTKRNSYNLKLKKSKLARALTNKKLVYLQHGVNGLKRVPDFHKNRDVFDLVIAPSEFEKQMIVEDWGYDETEVVATGLARWDGLIDKTDQVPYRQIFLMPTWRTWMDGMERDKFVESEYFKKYNEFLSSERLHYLLEENNVEIKFFLHPKFRDYIDLFDSSSPNIEKFGFLETPLDEMIMKSSLMISDYSSVIWEMFYLQKPCVFFHFDKDKYLEYEGSYMNFDTDLFGDVAYDTEGLVNIIEDYIHNEFEEKEKYAEMRNDYFTFADYHNSERIYEAIEENKDWLVSNSLRIPKFKLSHIIPYSLRRKLLDWKNRILA
ncbi:CDP-glycerol glycerophosphotransferase family protein [Tetragenococcus halophilus]|uniref:CDP-glycerol glycerophosphotransferase family protein n=1 Tax=Tetragenococcus halophilus TaxID=51669 RepID=UPI00209B1C7A|nr:CDP-glycerol glycerophosphotransferase family protein [Tetragenococcus halophilus]MCO8289711.1 CDP-glycerol glycerophosphotransferase family protein [Tetragenococcus halophilus]